jgi:uncharacterized repeat protein (TIGR03803 family)
MLTHHREPVSPRRFSLITKSEESMSRNKSLESVSKALIVMATAILTFMPSARAQTKFKTLYQFKGGADGEFPLTSVTFDQAGNLYGTTQGGGSGDGCVSNPDCGTVFKLKPNADGSWTESVLYRFCSDMYCGDGAGPTSGVIFDQAGNLWGTTRSGGAGGACPEQGSCGLVFKLTPNADGSWTEAVVYDFCSLTNCADGANPSASLVFDTAGILYGTTNQGGNSGCYQNLGCGVVFKLAPTGDSWTESTLHTFTGPPGDGAYCYAGLIVDEAGENLYGTTYGGGRYQWGTVFRLKRNNASWSENTLHSFTGGNSGGKHGAAPYAALVFGSGGNLYGTTAHGGNYQWGTVFELTPNIGGGWTETVLHRFTGGNNGMSPVAGVIFDQAGNLYGTTPSGGNLSYCQGFGCGLVFKLTPNSNGGWSETVLHRFVDQQGASPSGGLILDAAGNLYGTTEGDGTTTFGSVFEITP